MISEPVFIQHLQKSRKVFCEMLTIGIDRNDILISLFKGDSEALSQSKSLSPVRNKKRNGQQGKGLECLLFHLLIRH